MVAASMEDAQNVNALSLQKGEHFPPWSSCFRITAVGVQRLVKQRLLLG